MLRFSSPRSCFFWLGYPVGSTLRGTLHSLPTGYYGYGYTVLRFKAFCRFTTVVRLHVCSWLRYLTFIYLRSPDRQFPLTRFVALQLPLHTGWLYFTLPHMLLRHYTAAVLQDCRYGSQHHGLPLPTFAAFTFWDATQVTLGWLAVAFTRVTHIAVISVHPTHSSLVCSPCYLLRFLPLLVCAPTIAVPRWFTPFNIFCWTRLLQTLPSHYGYYVGLPHLVWFPIPTPDLVHAWT